MRKNKILKQTEKIKLKQKVEFNEINYYIYYIVWSSKLKKFLLQFGTNKNPLRVLDPETLQISISIQLNIKIITMKLTKEEDQLVIWGNDRSFYVIALGNFIIKYKCIPSIPNFYSFVFADKSCKIVFASSYYDGLCKINLVSGRIKKLDLKGLKNSYHNNFIISQDYKTLYGFFKNDRDNFPASYNVKKKFK